MSLFEPPVSLDRIALDDTPLGPIQLARAIHRQLGTKQGGGPVPVRSIAKALDIEAIRDVPVTGFEGALLTTPERDFGEILVKATSSRERQRFSIAHELGHFLIPSHATTYAHGSACKAADMAGSWPSPTVDDRHRRQEAEANSFAVELLLPSILVQSFLRSVPDLEAAFRMASACAVSREAASRRYVDLHHTPTAVLFAKEGILTYSSSNTEFPRLSVRPGDPLPIRPSRPAEPSIDAPEDADFRDWLVSRSRVDLTVQTAWQTNGFSTTLLSIDTSGHDPDDGNGEDGNGAGLGVPQFRR